MGFDVIYKYYERLPDGKYKTDELKEMKRKVGDPLDDTTLEFLASKILAQLARRDIMVDGVQVFEYAKKPITFKETQGGIILKNKKFTLDTVGHSLEAKEIPSQHATHVVPQHLSAGVEERIQSNSSIPVPSELLGQVPQRVEIFDPEPDHLAAGLVRGKFTKGKKYPIFGEQRDAREDKLSQKLPILYITIDDNGQKTLTPGLAFRPSTPGLIGNFETGSRSSNKDGLVWDGIRGDNDDIDARMQSIRRR